MKTPALRTAPAGQPVWPLAPGRGADASDQRVELAQVAHGLAAASLQPGARVPLAKAGTPARVPRQALLQPMPACTGAARRPRAPGWADGRALRDVAPRGVLHAGSCSPVPGLQPHPGLRKPPALPAAPAPPEGRPAVLVDKDGTLVENVPHNVDPALLRFMPAAAGALAALAEAGFAILVVTHQSGLAHGYFTRAQLAQLQGALQQRLRAMSGVELLDFVVCPHAPGPGGAPACLCRQPAPGLLLRAARMHRLDLSRSWMVGDTLDDVEAGRRAGCATVLFDSGGETRWRRSPLRRPTAACTDWEAVAQLILAHRKGSVAHEGSPLLPRP